MNFIFFFQIIEKDNGRSRSKVFKEIEIFHLCQGQDNILQLYEYFEESERFYLVFDKMQGGKEEKHCTSLQCFIMFNG